MNRQLRAFGAAFLLTLLLMGFGGGMAVVEASASSGLHRAVPFLAIRREAPLDVTVSLLGNTLRLPMEELNSFAAFVERYATLLLPRSLRLAGQGFTLGAHQLRDWQAVELERRYQESIS